MPQTDEHQSMFLDHQSQPRLTELQSLVFESESWAGYQGPDIHQRRKMRQSVPQYTGCPVGVRYDSFCNRVRCEGIHYTCIGCNKSKSTRAKAPQTHVNHLICKSVASQKINSSNIEATYIAQSPTFAIGAFNLYTNYDGTVNMKSTQKLTMQTKCHDVLASSEHNIQKTPTAVHKQVVDNLAAHHNDNVVSKNAHNVMAPLHIERTNDVSKVMSTPTKLLPIENCAKLSAIEDTCWEDLPPMLPLTVSTCTAATIKPLLPTNNSASKTGSALDFLNTLTENIGGNDYDKSIVKDSTNVHHPKDIKSSITLSMSKELEEHLSDLPPLIPPPSVTRHRSVSLEDRRFSSEPLVHVYEHPVFKSLSQKSSMTKSDKLDCHPQDLKSKDIKQEMISPVEHLKAHGAQHTHVAHDDVSDFTVLSMKKEESISDVSLISPSTSIPSSAHSLDHSNHSLSPIATEPLSTTDSEPNTANLLLNVQHPSQSNNHTSTMNSNASCALQMLAKNMKENFKRKSEEKLSCGEKSLKSPEKQSRSELVAEIDNETKAISSEIEKTSDDLPLRLSSAENTATTDALSDEQLSTTSQDTIKAEDVIEIDGEKTPAIVEKPQKRGYAKRRRLKRKGASNEQVLKEDALEYFGRYANDNDLFLCPVCSLKMQGLLEYFDHTVEAHNVFICHQCLKEFNTKCSLLRHRPIHHGVKRYSCSVCSHQFHRRDKCKLHMKKLHDGDGDIEDILGMFPSTVTPSRPIDETGTWQCEEKSSKKKKKKSKSTETENNTEPNVLGKALSNLKKVENKVANMNGGFDDSNSSNCMDLWHNRDPYLQAIDTNTDTNSLPELTISQVASQIGDTESDPASTGLTELGDSNGTSYLDLDSAKSISDDFVPTTPEKTYTELTSFNNVSVVKPSHDRSSTAYSPFSYETMESYHMIPPATTLSVPPPAYPGHLMQNQGQSHIMGHSGQLSVPGHQGQPNIQGSQGHLNMPGHDGHIDIIHPPPPYETSREVITPPMQPKIFKAENSTPSRKRKLTGDSVSAPSPSKAKRRQNGNPDSPHVCTICPNRPTFTTNSSLQRHHSIHVTEKARFECSLCHKPYHRKDKCKDHIKYHHKDEEDATVIDNK